MLDSTLVVWGAEFGRTPLGENRTGREANTGRDHHPFAFSLWMAAVVFAAAKYTVKPMKSGGASRRSSSYERLSRYPTASVRVGSLETDSTVIRVVIFA